MYLLPAIDILNGQVVRLAQGDYDQVTVYNADPVQQALDFAAEGATWLHIVDLDGARTGEQSNLDVISCIIASSGLNVEVGGGVRNLIAIERLLDAGCTRVVLGTKLITEPQFARCAVREFGEAICAGVDARDGEVAIEGWRAGSGVAASELIAEMAGWGIRHLVYTDISRDGMQTGIDAAAYQRVAEAAGFAVIASGGISSLSDIEALAALGPDIIEGAIAGRAIYEGSFSVAEGIAAC
ncbi:MAG: 1-(5-phosphoribosyl)-5-[(5-phosphoribosylamino)methylideneamino]imidazole-4-carboxamide isomerase [Coriobacteriales bacterium]|jgi:phosphoribosylformimino-5-aminoimidazole carboxamide ribotide isomerase|nr:1-(5-phosphoribosyl)-5-[(5-phosphoribosylamino)methylideneamino]imidazole-4-carboxamide isomerase [Coriobacteriales bacterium]